MGTQIKIKFNEDISPERLDELIGQIAAQCSEDENGESWTEDSKVYITCNMKDKLSEDLRNKVKKELMDFRHEYMLDWSRGDCSEEIGYYYSDYLDEMDDSALIAELRDQTESEWNEEEPLKKLHNEIEADLAIRKGLSDDSENL